MRGNSSFNNSPELQSFIQKTTIEGGNSESLNVTKTVNSHNSDKGANLNMNQKLAMLLKFNLNQDGFAN